MDLLPPSAHPFSVNFSNVTKQETLLKVVQSFPEIKKTLAFGFVQASTLDEVKQGSNDRQKEMLEKFLTKKGWERRIYGDWTKSGNTKNLIHSHEPPKRVMKPASKYRSHG